MHFRVEVSTVRANVASDCSVFQVKRVGVTTQYDNTRSKEVLGIQYTEMAKTVVDMGETLIVQVRCVCFRRECAHVT